MEDSEADMTLMARLLRKSGYPLESRRVEDRETLIEALQTSCWDIIVVDYQLPQLNAPHILRITQEIAPQTPCIVVTGTIGEETAVEMMRQGAADVIIKSNLSRFVPAVERELREAENRRLKERFSRLRQEELRVLELVARGTPLPDVFIALTRLAEREIPGTRCAVLLTDYRGQIAQIHSPSLPLPLREELTRLQLESPQSNCLEEVSLWCKVLRSTVTPPSGEGFSPLVPAERVLGAVALFGEPARELGYLDQQVLATVEQVCVIALERERAETERRDAEARLRMVVSQLPAIVWVADAEGRLTFFEGLGASSLGIVCGEVLGQSVYQVFGEEPHIRENLERTLAGQKTQWEMTWRGASLITHAALVSTEQGVFVVGVTVDVSEQRLLQAQLLQSAKMAAMGELIAGVVHELNNPLTVISVRAELLALAASPEIQEDAETIYRMAQRMGRLVRSLLDFSRFSAPEEVTVDWNQVVTAAVEIARLGLKKSGVTLELDLGVGVPRVRVKPDQIEQVLLNLIHNAEYAMRGREPDQKKVVIQTRYLENTALGQVEVSVQDRGCGIPEADRPRIFEPFFTTKPQGEGTGLGLSMSHGIIAQHGGSITFESEVDEGTTFRVRIPVIEVREA